jgi:hypothetical protein
MTPRLMTRSPQPNVGILPGNRATCPQTIRYRHSPRRRPSDATRHLISQTCFGPVRHHHSARSAARGSYGPAWTPENWLSTSRTGSAITRTAGVVPPRPAQRSSPPNAVCCCPTTANTAPPPTGGQRRATTGTVRELDTERRQTPMLRSPRRAVQSAWAMSASRVPKLEHGR